LFYRLKGN